MSIEDTKARLVARDRMRQMARSIMAHLDHEGPVLGTDGVRYDPESQSVVIDVSTLQRCMLADFLVNGRSVVVCIVDEKETVR